MTSVDLKLNYLTAARHEPLTCLGKLIKSAAGFPTPRRRCAPRGRLVAHGTSTLMRLPDAD